MKRHNIYIILFIALLCAPLHCAKGGERAYFSLLTCSPGEEVYAFFGHTALRYRNPEKGMDFVFNYGVFDFSEPGFVAKFVSGETDYMLGVTEYPYFIQEYAMRGSGVVEQVLALDSLQVQQLFSLLRDNYRPENCIYRYNYFYNNCTTKARDIIESAVGNGIAIKYPSESGDQPTFREVVHRFTAVSPWYSFGIDLLLGYEADLPQSERVLQFIPSTLQNDFAKAFIVHSTGSSKPLVANTNILLEPQEAEKSGTSIFTPSLFFTLLFILMLLVTAIERRKGKIYWGIDLLLMLAQGIAGSIIAYMLLFSIHPTVGSNLLIILLNPLPLLIAPMYIYCVIKGKRPRIIWVQTFLSLLFLVSAPMLPQYFPLPIYILAATLLTRSIFITLYTRK